MVEEFGFGYQVCGDGFVPGLVAGFFGGFGLQDFLDLLAEFFFVWFFFAVVVAADADGFDGGADEVCEGTGSSKLR